MIEEANLAVDVDVDNVVNVVPMTNIINKQFVSPTAEGCITNTN